MKKPKPIKSRIMWMVVDPQGRLLVNRASANRVTLRRGLADNQHQWRALEHKGWRIVRVLIEPMLKIE